MGSEQILANLRQTAQSLGFSSLGVSDIDLSQAEPYLIEWLSKGFHGEMGYMAKHGVKRSRPAELVPGTVSIITVTFPYLKVSREESWKTIQQPDSAYIARYALGNDYHDVIRERLHTLANAIKAELGTLGYRVFVDSAPILEVEVAQKAGLGWRGKHTLLLSRQQGSFFFLGEIFTDYSFTPTEPTSSHCGSCSRCIAICPTQAIIEPYKLDARRCIAYLTIELKGVIPEEFRSMIGNRIYGCDDCQLVCPWNKYATLSQEIRFESQAQLEQLSLLDLWSWSEVEFKEKLKGSPILRIGYACWRRNIAVGLGNATPSKTILNALIETYPEDCDLVRAHSSWAIEKQLNGLEVC
ncbi:MAG: tRNA epoxyqueuosine(34) reductase QueG [Pseudomonadota bacterium]